MNTFILCSGFLIVACCLWAFSPLLVGIAIGLIMIGAAIDGNEY